MPERKPGCCKVPNGLILLAPSISSFVALLLSVISLFSCVFITRVEILSFLRFTYDLGLWSWGQNSSDSSEEGVSEENTCYRYANDDPVDTTLELARVFGVISIICGGITLIVTWFSTCMPFTKRSLCFVVLLYFTTAVCEALKLMIFSAKICAERIGNSEWESCDLSVGSTLCIISAGLWIVGASFFIWAMHDLVEYVEDDYY